MVRCRAMAAQISNRKRRNFPASESRQESLRTRSPASARVGLGERVLGTGSVALATVLISAYRTQKYRTPAMIVSSGTALESIGLQPFRAQDFPNVAKRSEGFRKRE